MEDNIAEQLEKLAKLHSSGMLSEEEFARAKARILDEDEAPDADQPAPQAENAESRPKLNMPYPDPDRDPLPRPFNQVYRDNDLGRAANRWVSLQTVMSVIGVILFCIFALSFCSTQSKFERDFDRRWDSFPGNSSSPLSR
ncbi:SHOCT domain-containing protein [Rubritalea squalenifaciens]|nr:SHOCT domain-containing protein [Rubritalea squalenifaciens]